MSHETVAAALQSAYRDLSPQLRQAAQFVLDRPDDVALHSMRTLAGLAGVHPSTMVRLAQRLDFDGYNDFRDVFRARLSGYRARFSGQARALRDRGRSGEEDVVRAIADADSANLIHTYQEIDPRRLTRSADALNQARRIYVIGLRGCYPIAHYFSYAASMFRDDVICLDGRAGVFADELRRAGDKDVALAISFSPYTRETIRAVNFARNRNTRIIAITDALRSPLVADAFEVLLVHCATPFFFQSVTAAMSVVQCLVASMLAEGDEQALAVLMESERQLESVNAYLDDVPTRYEMT